MAADDPVKCPSLDQIREWADTAGPILYDTKAKLHALADTLERQGEALREELSLLPRRGPCPTGRLLATIDSLKAEAAKGNPFADCNCLEDYELKEKPKTHEFRCDMTFGGKVQSDRGPHDYTPGECFLSEDEHRCAICSKPFSDSAHS